ncbi:MAG: rhodanese-like domain-containing protein [Gammaproteobacteria bacterium]|nr:rhodanese-like domain-containing protein [Gammaproteobacteria bacterium]
MKKIFLFCLLSLSGFSFALDVQISNDIETVEVTHKGKKIVIQRNQDTNNTLNPIYSRTSRKCPPFCVQPAILAEGVETIAELEVLNYLSSISKGDDSILVIDSRTPDWLRNGTIPGSENIPWTQLNVGHGADPFEMADLLENRFGARIQEGIWDFSNVKTLILFCNGMWCGQSPSNIRTLLRLGYPASKLKWYRGGMQNWENLGLTVIK